MHLPYLQNNIIFRIASADAQSKFKAAQAHSFIQVCRSEFEFNEAAREVLLLSYDRISTWVLRVERSFLSLGSTPINGDFKARIIGDLAELFKSTEEVLLDHTSVFDAQLTDYVRMVHRYSGLILRNSLTRELSADVCKAYPNMLVVLTKYLQHLLLALHEYNNNIIRKRPAFICVADFSLLTDDVALKYSSMISRACYFNDNFGLNTFTIKNYTVDDIEDDVINMLHDLSFNVSKETQ
jgi:hypothetical protein